MGITPLSSSPSADPKQATSVQVDRERVMRELRIMFRYACGAGLEIDRDTELLVSAAIGEEGELSSREKEVLAGLYHRISLTHDEIVEYPHLSEVVTDRNNLSLLFAAHSALAKVVAPATPISLEATEPLPGWLGSIRRPPLVLAMLIIALVAILGFLITSVISVDTPKASPSEKKVGLARHDEIPMSIQVAAFVFFLEDGPSLGVSPNAPSWQKQLNWCFAAALGAVFYILFTVHEYVKNRTFDPRYNSVYVVRFALGILSGLILANVLSTPRFNGNETLRSLGPAVGALLGGFSTEAVYQVLQRLVEITLAAVRGDNSSAAKVQASEKARDELLSLAADPRMSRQTVAKLHAAAKKVGK